MTTINKTNFSISKFHDFPVLFNNLQPMGTFFDLESSAWRKNERSFLLAQSLNSCTIDGVVCEFGVGKGITITQIANHFNTEVVYGFDSFIGLPEDWIISDSLSLPKDGGSPLTGILPEVPNNTSLVKGWYNETLPVWLNENQSNIKFLHLDSDLYSSTLTVLNLCNSLIVPGTVIQFDEFYPWGDDMSDMFTKWQEWEYKALKEWTETNDREFEPLHRNNYFQCAIKITK
jgi:hypothetical protein